MRILSVIGTRPEGIKMAPVIQELRQHAGTVESLVCHTGQHREMLDQVLELFGVVAHYRLDVMEPDQRLGRLTARLIESLDNVIVTTKPDWVIAQGDTTTTLAASITSHYNKVRFGHVEAGLRSGMLDNPFPEEANRRLSAVLADAHFAPTNRARNALLAEGVKASSILVTGNTITDALQAMVCHPMPLESQCLKSLASDREMVLITAHRRESFGGPMRDLCCAIRELATSFADKQFVFPVHLNPNVRKPVQEILTGLANVILLDPVDYLTMVALMKRATLILTDSGGIQEEAPSLGVPVLVMRAVTERPEGVSAGVARLIGTKPERIIAEATRLLSDEREAEAMRRSVNPYGDGMAARRIVSYLLGREVEPFESSY